MVLQRVAKPLSILASRATQQVSTPSISTSPCLRCLSRTLTTPIRPYRSRRSLSTATALRPQDLETHAPPRNAGIPDTSIAGDRAAALNAETPPPNPASRQNESEISLPEGEAQKITSTASGAVGSVASPDSTAAASSRPQRKSKLRPRKAAMTLSGAAVQALRELLEQPEPKMIRVGVKNRGCSGLAYHLEYVERAGAFDEAVEQDGVRVLIDSKALFSIIGSEMDWVEDKLSRRFVFRNPNISEFVSCSGSVFLLPCPCRVWQI